MTELTVDLQPNSAQPQSTAYEAQRSDVITVEHALYVSLVLLGAAVRFWGLGQAPLSALEALNSWAAWQDAMGLHTYALTPTSPLLLSLLRLVFWLGADGEAAARAVNAVAGSLLILVAWPLRGLLGRTAAIALTLFLAVDPWLVAFSRLADGAMLSAGLAMALLTTLVVHAQMGGKDSSGQSRALSSVTALLTGLLVTSGQMAWSFLPILVLFVALNTDSIRQSFIVDALSLLWLIGGFLVGATGWLLYPQDIGLVSGSLTQWANSVLATGASMHAVDGAEKYPLLWPIGRAMADQPFITLFGIGGILHMTWRGCPATYGAMRWRTLLWFWLAWGVLLCALPGRSPFSLLVLVMPLLFGAAYAVGQLVDNAPIASKWREMLLVAAVLLILLVSVQFIATTLISNSTLIWLDLQELLLASVLVITVLLFTGIWMGWRASSWTGIAVIGATLLFMNAGGMWRTSHWAEQGRPAALFAQNSDQDVLQIARDIERFSAQRIGDAYQAPVRIEKASGGFVSSEGDEWGLSEPSALVLGWTLRNMRDVQWGLSGIDDVTANSVAITSANSEAPDVLSGSGNYAGRRYGVSWRQAGVGETDDPYADVNAEGFGPRIKEAWTDSIQPRLIWAIYRTGPLPSDTEEVILWAPLDDAVPESGMAALNNDSGQ